MKLLQKKNVSMYIHIYLDKYLFHFVFCWNNIEYCDEKVRGW